MGVSGETWAALALASIFVTPFVLCLLSVPWLVHAARRRRTRATDSGVLSRSDEVFNPEASAPTGGTDVTSALPLTVPLPGDAALHVGRIRLDV